MNFIKNIDYFFFFDFLEVFGAVFFLNLGGFAAFAIINSIACSKLMSSKVKDLGKVALILLYST